MSDVKKIATRESYGSELTAIGRDYPNVVVLDADLTKSTKTCVFQKEFPERHINCGIAEANMASIAAGLATTGKIPFMQRSCYTPDMFSFFHGLRWRTALMY